MKPRARFDILNIFFGYGNPQTTKILFIGIEEGGNWSPDAIHSSSPERANKKYEEVLDEILEIYKKGYLTQSDFYKAFPNWSKFFKITNRKQVYLSLLLQNKLWGCNNDLDNVQALRDYYLHEFCSRIEFQANIFPIANDTVETWKGDYKNIFDAPAQKEDYYSSCIQARVIVLSKLIEEIKRKNDSPYIFVMGKSTIWEHKKRWEIIKSTIFRDIDFEPVETGSRNNRIACSKDKKIGLSLIQVVVSV